MGGAEVIDGVKDGVALVIAAVGAVAEDGGRAVVFKLDGAEKIEVPVIKEQGEIGDIKIVV